jgi:hypothetical protein
MKGNKLVFVIPFVTAIVSMLLFWVALVNSWFGPAANVGGNFCEACREGLIKQPANTWSNIGFIVSGLYIAWALMQGAYHQNNNSITRNIFYAVFFCCLVVLLGPGSMAMHATTTSAGGFFDMLSMYLVAAFMVGYSMERFFKLQPAHFIIIFSAVLVSCLFAHYAHYHIIFGFFGVTAFAFYITVAIIFEALNIYVRKKEHQTRWAYFGLASLLLAFFIWGLSHTGGPLCNPYSYIQGHAIWHLLNALALYFLFRYYASEHSATLA